MILQYKGHNNNWCYEEANTIVWAIVGLHEITDKYKEPIGDTSKIAESLDLIRETHKEIETYIEKETKCSNDIIYLIGDSLLVDLKNICVVTLKDKNKYVTYVFKQGNGVYILNNSGGTVQRIS
jgi:L-fucose mutarotase/ribose pyranase (RbsD/FucU family)